jgi:putative endonuclease
MFYVYILECADATYYTGSTTDLEKRVRQHNFSKAGARYTKARRPVKLEYFEQYDTYAEARKREAAIKRLTKKQKLLLIHHVISSKPAL